MKDISKVREETRGALLAGLNPDLLDNILLRLPSAKRAPNAREVQ